MENSRAGRLRPTALMLGNIVTGRSVLAPRRHHRELLHTIGFVVLALILVVVSRSRPAAAALA
ncbi:membrane-bound metal-dependent hydrolase YbcI (DUF457 family) [Bradyrhizobium sp. F1.4.3]|uniref:hypothetical protein n=1 Tax=Bradyrhizobium sp. F1.4.3 TaxID=3156356 RepID=UPI003396E68D